MALNALPFSLVALVALVAGCGGGASPRLVDGSRAADVPAVLAGLDGAVMTRARTVLANEIDGRRLEACGLRPRNKGAVVVERIGLNGSSLTFRVGASLNACDRIPNPVRDPDRPYARSSCGGSVGRLRGGRLADPRLHLCTAENGKLTAFVWVEPEGDAKWIALAEGDRREVYEVVGSLVAPESDPDPAPTAAA